jgi:hypothetical protein
MKFTLPRRNIINRFYKLNGLHKTRFVLINVFQEGRSLTALYMNASSVTSRRCIIGCCQEYKQGGYNGSEEESNSEEKGPGQEGAGEEKSSG